ncbi:hypothetical protein MNBD_DELTA01-1632 [hydrothermal vent metagenome]|uniref:Phage protein n=1 Tax=hydrothermal vent metagenome TaxID=652676 RepID=A0A3B0QZU6_9ZZZZ
MSNFDTIKAITENIQGVLEGLGIKFSQKAFEDSKDVPASLLPYGEVFYTGESFEETSGERPSYVEADFTLVVILRERFARDLVRAEQDWVHRIRGALGVDALNIGGLAVSKLVSRVTSGSVGMDKGSGKSGLGILSYQAKVRYREG